MDTFPQIIFIKIDIQEELISNFIGFPYKNGRMTSSYSKFIFGPFENQFTNDPQLLVSGYHYTIIAIKVELVDKPVEEAESIKNGF